METLQTILLVLQVLVAISLIGLILIQHGKGADAGAAFGSGASSTVFGAQGSGNFLSRTTAILAFIFLANSLGLAWIASQRVQSSGSLMEQPFTEVQTLPEQTPDINSEIPSDPIASPVSEVPVMPASMNDMSGSIQAEAPAAETATVPDLQTEPLPAAEIGVPAEPAAVPAE